MIKPLKLNYTFPTAEYKTIAVLLPPATTYSIY